jgi:tetratricopeptide (TPR) repeat protein
MSIQKKHKYLLVFLLLFFACDQKFFAQEKQKDCCSARIDSMLNILPAQKEDSNRVKTLLNIAWDKFNLAWSRNGDYESAIDYANQGLTLTDKIKFKWGKGRGNFVLGRCYELKADYAESLKHHFTALKVGLEMGNKTLTHVEYYDIGKIYNRLANYPEALKNYFAAYRIVKEVKDDYWLADITSRIGTVYFNQGNHTEAVKFYDDAFNLAEKIKDELIMADVWGYRGNMSLSIGKYDEAIHYFKNGLKIYEKRPVKSYIATFNGYLAIAYIKKAESSSDSLSARYYYSDAIQYLQKALVLIKEYGGKEKLISNYSLLSEAYRGIRDYKNALVYTDLYYQILDSSYNKSAYIRIADLKVQYEIEKASTELKAAQEKEKIKQEALRDKILADQKLQQEKILADERLAHVKEIADQKLKKELAVSEEKTKAENSITLEKERQKKLREEKQQVNNLLLMGLILVAVTSAFLILYIRQSHQKKIAVEKAETIHKMAELEMQSLRSQLNPHFMFNSLNSIQSLILKEDSDKSHSYLSRFARLLRMLLENADKPFIPLWKEMDFLHLYLGLESLRIPDMQYSVSIDPVLNTEQTLIPNMFLQPYVENAIWHGLSHKEKDKQLQIRIYRENGTVNYEIEDNGVGRKKAEELKSLFRKQHQSKGMELLNKRIKLLNTEYSSSIETAITDVLNYDEVTGTLVTIKIPLKLSEPHLY